MGDYAVDGCRDEVVLHLGVLTLLGFGEEVGLGFETGKGVLDHHVLGLCELFLLVGEMLLLLGGNEQFKDGILDEAVLTVGVLL